ncbi:YbjN domain-containing protein [Sphingomonas montanisoli]|uniref:YbjN domain-containing protein n=1 Tax=Sphingomonas montanisoli TaxID=2606412 RepID=A0A5D9C7B3_9SPHN|nr:YbjN domain-containing protein [Sphingomonas montanisoli]TZG27579.1 hypothetical protein FYJ91_08310 [Sphingomonas montanisoli]
MDVDDFESVRFSGTPIDLLEQYFAAHGWSHERQGDDEVVAQYAGSWAKYELRAVWREEDSVLQFLAFPDIRVTTDKRSAVYETMGLINEQLWLGHFELWQSSGLVLFRHAALLERSDDMVLTLDQAETLVETAIDECERFYPVFQFVLWSDKSPADAIASAMIETRGEA